MTKAWGSLWLLLWLPWKEAKAQVINSKIPKGYRTLSLIFLVLYKYYMKLWLLTLFITYQNKALLHSFHLVLNIFFELPSRYICRFWQLDSWLNNNICEKIFEWEILYVSISSFQTTLFSSVCIPQLCDNVTVFWQSDNRAFLEELDRKNSSVFIWQSVVN